MASTVSLSKGCFVFKNGKKSKTKRNAKIQDEKQTLLLAEGERPSRLEELRYKTYRELADGIEEKIQELERDYHHELFQQISDFVNRVGPLRSGFAEDIIPAAVLVTGINMPDHNRLFSMMSSHLEEHSTPLVGRLNSKDCSSVKLLVQKLVGQIMQEKEEAPEIDEDEEDQATKHSFKRSICTLATLSAWYKEKYADSNSGNTPSKNAVVVIFEDFEGLPFTVLEDVISIVSEYRRHIPFVFIFGVATSTAVVQNTLTYTVSSRIAIENFQSQPSVHFLNKVLDKEVSFKYLQSNPGLSDRANIIMLKVVFSKMLPFKLGSRIFNLLMDLFLYHDFAVSNFISSLKFCMIEHYFSNQSSVLCCDLANGKERIKGMQSNELTTFRELPSFQKISESKRAKFSGDVEFKRYLEESVEKIHLYISRFNAFVGALNKLAGGLPNAPLGKQFRETYILAATSPIFETEAYKNVFQLLRLLSKDELKRRISEAVIAFNSILSQENVAFHRIQDHLATFLYSLQTVGDVPIEEVEEDTCFDLGKKMSKAELQEKLMEAAKKKRKLSPFEQLRAEILGFFDAEFRENLVPPTELPFHEIFIFDNVQAVKRHLIGTPRSALQVALTNPHVYLQCDCCRIEDSSVIQETMPDTCVAYKLHLECGKLINLYDWLQSFAAIVGQHDTDEGVSEDIQARFSQAVSELQYIGFIKQSKRKVDHVARNTF